MDLNTPHPANVPGDFYVVNGCCLMCEVPFQEAPHLFAVAHTPYPHCYIKQQPANSDELNQMIMTIQCADLRCIRYRGTETKVLARLVELGEATACDHLDPPSSTGGVS